MTEPNDPGPVPGEKRTRRLSVNLPEEVEAKVRKVAEVTGLPIYGLAEHVAGSPGFAEACIQALRDRYDASAASFFSSHQDLRSQGLTMHSFKLTDKRVGALEFAGVTSIRDLFRVLAALDLRARVELEFNYNQETPPPEPAAKETK